MKEMIQTNIKVRLEWKLEDFWVGVFWRRFLGGVDVWICVLPCLPIHISLWKVKCPRCGALVKRLGKDTVGTRAACCIECAWNPNGCRCRFGEYGEPEKAPFYSMEEDDQ